MGEAIHAGPAPLRARDDVVDQGEVARLARLQEASLEALERAIRGEHVAEARHEDDLPAADRPRHHLRVELAHYSARNFMRCWPTVQRTPAGGGAARAARGRGG